MLRLFASALRSPSIIRFHRPARSSTASTWVDQLISPQNSKRARCERVSRTNLHELRNVAKAVQFVEPDADSVPTGESYVGHASGRRLRESCALFLAEGRHRVNSPVDVS